MSDLRKDPIVGRWVIVAENRAARPNDFEADPQSCQHSIPACPFCEGNESHTPAEIMALRRRDSRPDREGWRVRVVPNKFPALEAEGGSNECRERPLADAQNVNRHGAEPDGDLSDVDNREDSLCATMPGVGAHEVIIESPQHITSTSQLSEDHLADVLRVYRDRLSQLSCDRRLAYGMVFKNVGQAAGATLEHLHAQLIATPIAPINVCEEMNGSLKFYDSNGCCVYCAMLREELQCKKRIVFETPGFAAFCPFASRFAYETWIVPKKHASRYENIDTADLSELSVVLKNVVRKLEDALEKPAYNYIIHTAPFDTDELGHYHWHIEIMPRVTKVAGFEWGTGFYINPTAPENAAAVLREI